MAINPIALMIAAFGRDIVVEVVRAVLAAHPGTPIYLSSTKFKFRCLEHSAWSYSLIASKVFISTLVVSF